MTEKLQRTFITTVSAPTFKASTSSINTSSFARALVWATYTEEELRNRYIFYVPLVKFILLPKDHSCRSKSTDGTGLSQ